MGVIIGREREFGQALQGLQKARRDSVPTVVRISGVSGIGKTALLESLLAAAAESWLVVRVDCHRIQAGSPLVVIRRTLSATLSALGEQRERYNAGLEAAGSESAALPPDSLLLRLLEGVSIDHPLVIAFDDAQWADAESVRATQQILQALSDRSIVVVTTERAGEGLLGTPLDADTSVALERLSDQDASRLVESIYPEAPPDVVKAIVEQCAGHPLDLRELAASAREHRIATREALSTSLDSLIARYLRSLSPELREFLQICSLIAEPIEDSVLAQLWPDDKILLGLAERATTRYMTRDSEGLHFVHAAIAEGIRRTIPLEIPYRRRILTALQALEPTLETLERIVEQAAACADRGLQRSTLIGQAAKAEELRALAAAARAYDRALDVSSPAPEELIGFYTNHVTVLSAIGRFRDARTVTERALKEAQRNGLQDGLGALVSRLILSMWSTEERAIAIETYERFLPIFESPQDLAELYSVSLWIHCANVDKVRFEQTLGQLRSVMADLPGVLGIRMNLFEAWLRARTNDRAQARRNLAAAARIAQETSPLTAAVVRQATIVMDFLEFGPQSVSESLSSAVRETARGPRQVSGIDYIAAMHGFASGNWDAVSEIINAASLQSTDPVDFRRFLGIATAMSALSGQPLPVESRIRKELALFEEEPRGSLLPIAMWWSAIVAKTDPGFARRLIEKALPTLQRPHDVVTTYMPFGLVIAAEALADRKLLETLASEHTYWHDSLPWNEAQKRLAQAAARHALTNKDGRTELIDVARSFDAFGAPLFSAIARNRVNNRNAQDDAVLASCGLALTKTSTFNLSRREQEVVGLVALGKTNREIAEQLVLSERTVEAHLSSAFNKTGASTRTQLTRLYLGATSPVA